MSPRSRPEAAESTAASKRVAKPVSQPHDKAYKLLFCDPVLVEEFCKDFLGEELVADVDFSTLERLPAEFISETWEQRADDIIWRVRFKDGRPCYLVLILEFQKEPDADMALRILTYCALLLQALAPTEEVKRYGYPPILPIVIYIGEEEWNVASSVRERFMRGTSRRVLWFCPQQRYLLVNVRKLADEDLVDKGIAAQVFRLERAADMHELRALVREVARRFGRQRKYRNVLRVVTDWLKVVLVKRYPIPESVQEEIHDLEGLSTMLERNIDKMLDRYVQQGLAQGMAQGLEQGLAQGEERGIRIGLARGEERGFLNALFSCVGDGSLPLAVAAAKANMSEDEFTARMREQSQGS